MYKRDARVGTVFALYTSKNKLPHGTKENEVKSMSINNMPVLGIILGDHAGSSPEMAAKAVLASDGSYIPVFTGNLERFKISCTNVAERSIDTLPSSSTSTSNCASIPIAS